MWWKKNRWKVIIPLLVVVILAAAFYFGGNAPGTRGWSVSATPTPTVSADADVNSPEPAVSARPGGEEKDEPPEESAAPTAAPEQTEEPEKSAEPTAEPTATPETAPESTAEPSPSKDPEADRIYSEENGMEINPETGKDKYNTDPVPEGKPLPVEPENVTVGSTALTCTVSISCATILDNMSYCKAEKKELVPEDGWILEETQVTFYEGESVFNVLQRVCKQNKIHMEFSNTPMYNSAYIEGINNLYEFDVGELSGWMYKVNDWFPNYGCSRYQLKDGDVVCWVYTCDRGYDVGGGYAVGG